MSSPNLSQSGRARQTDDNRMAVRLPRYNLRHIARQIKLLHPHTCFAIAAFGFDEKVIALRIFHPDEHAAAIKFAAYWNGRGEAVWITLGALSERHPRNKPVNDKDVTRRCGILVDADVVKPPNAAKRSSTEAEHKAARHRAIEIAGYIIDIWRTLSDDGRFPYPMLNDSGNGAHLVIPADLPNDGATRNLIKNFLRALARRFPSDDLIQIDTKVFNAGRWIKLTGTWARKGEHTTERPHRMAKILLMPLSRERVMPVTPAMLQAVIDDNPPSAKPEPKPKPSSPSASGTTNSQASKTGKLLPFHSNLGEQQIRFMRTGKLRARKSRSEEIQGVVNSAFSRHWPFAEVCKLMTNEDYPGSAKIIDIIKSRGRIVAIDYLQRSWTKAEAFCDSNPSLPNRDELRRQIQLLDIAINNLPWSGRDGATGLAILTFHLNLGEQLGDDTYGASIRRIALACGVNAPTAMRANYRLIKQGFITIIGSSKIIRAKAVNKSTQWRLNLHALAATAGTNRHNKNDAAARDNGDVLHHNSNEKKECENYCYDERHAQATYESSGHDVWHPKGLGKWCWRLWKKLKVEQAISLDELADQLEVKKRILRQRLAELRRYGLARSSEDDQWYRLKPELDPIAEVLDIKGAGQRRGKRHEAEQEDYHARLQDQQRENPGSNLRLISEATGKPIERHYSSEDDAHMREILRKVIDRSRQS